jgi:Ca2+-transporting ATPase
LQNPYPFTGLNDDEVNASIALHGKHMTQSQRQYTWLETMRTVVIEPMFLLLLACTLIYFVVGEFAEGIFLLGAILVVSGISIYQDSRSQKALDALKAFNEPNATLIRNNSLQILPTIEIVVGDFVECSEGQLIPADGKVLYANDFSVNESILTGESFSVFKQVSENNPPEVFHGTLVSSGLCVMKVTGIGKETRLNKIGKSIDDVVKQISPLHKQISKFVKSMAIIGAFIFLLILGMSYYESRDIVSSLLRGLTIAMSVLPEEIPVAFTTFMALGAWRLMKMGIIVKQTQTVEALGAATVLCLDKTGTITENRMELHSLYVHDGSHVLEYPFEKTSIADQLLRYAMWASEPVPFDPMEMALHAAYAGNIAEDERPSYRMVHEYPLSGKPPMMTHVFQMCDENPVIACKGAPEAVLKYCHLKVEEIKLVLQLVEQFSGKGLRVLAVSKGIYSGIFPEKQEEFQFEFIGLVAFIDPPKKGINHVFDQFYQAGLKLKIITGDNSLTTIAIAKSAGIKDFDKVVEGSELMEMDDIAFDKSIQSNQVFTRMFPEAKLKVINHLKDQGEIVAMTGDGVNDGPALKAAHIGIAMGKRGSETAKRAASIILTDDDLAKMIDATAMGRRIYSNLKKAIQYIISIHIPIILIVALPLVFQWIFPFIFSPVHVIFLELIMGPTCSIVYENEPMEPNTMSKPPRVANESFLKLKDLSLSIIQGIVITAGLLFAYQWSLAAEPNEAYTRTIVFSTLVLSNVFLTLVNRSFYFSILTTLKYHNSLLNVMLIITLLLLSCLVYIPGISDFFGLIYLSARDWGMTALIAFCSVMWFEVYKWIRRSRYKV